MNSELQKLQELFDAAITNVKSFDEDLTLDDLMHKINAYFMHNKDANKEELHWCLLKLKELEYCIIEEDTKVRTEITDLQKQMINHRKYLNTISVVQEDNDLEDE